MATENFSFKTLLGSDVAGYTSVNSLIDSIDVILRQRVFRNTTGPSNNHVMIFSGTWGENANGFWTSGLVNTENLTDSAVTTGKIASSAVTTAKINNLAVTEDKLGTGSVTAGKLAANSVLASNIADGQVTAAKLDAGLTTQILPSGMIAPFAGNATNPPSGWFYCRGQREQRSLYPGLDQVIGTTYGPYTAADGSPGDTHFQLPDLQSRVPVGFSSEVEFNAPGKTGGVKEVTLTAAQSGIAAHSHTVGPNVGSPPAPSGNTGSGNASITINTDGAHSHTVSEEGVKASGYFHQNAGSFGTLVPDTNTPTTSVAGSHAHSATDSGHSHSVQINNATASNAAQAHNNLQPYITLNYIIKI
jgi:microcystin-dependent protein